jgi:LPXTG-motif cell wall-anchored protein
VALTTEPPDDYQIIGLAYDFGPTGADITPPMTLILRYDPALCSEGITQEDLVIAYCDEQAGKWVPIASAVDTTSHTVTAQMSHLNLVAILGITAQVPSVSGVNESLVGGIIVGVIIIGAGAYFLVRRKRNTQSS